MIPTQEDQSCISDKYFDLIVKEDGDGYKDGAVQFLCDSIDNLVESQSNNVYNLISLGKTIKQLQDDSKAVLATKLCKGLNTMNETLWDFFQLDDFLEPCDNDVTFKCNEDVGLDVTTIDSMLQHFKMEFRDTMDHTAQCLANQTLDITIVNKLMTVATNSLQDTVEDSAGALWSLLFATGTDVLAGNIDLNKSLTNFIVKYVDESTAEALLNGYPVANFADIVSKVAIPVLTSAVYIDVKDRSIELVDKFFAVTDSIVFSAILALESNLSKLPDYINLPELLPRSLCGDLWRVKYGNTILVDAIGSTDDNYCHAHLTVCTTSGICLVGLDLVQQGAFKAMLPFQFQGEKCSEYKELGVIMKIKEQVSSLQVYMPSLFL